jgi:hypothetical protein
MVLYLIARPDQVKQKTLSVFAPWRFNCFLHIFHAFMLKKLSAFLKFVDFYGWMHF